ncbi:MAG TPA: MFS transporter [Acidimicrobiia bacterium]|nr:MFS transporter [Acidimicrobiia bacterium]
MSVPATATRSHRPHGLERTGRRVREGVIGGAAALVLLALVYAGSNRLANFDSALIGYAVGIVALTYAIVARYVRWLRMPSTARYWRRGWQLLGSWRSFRALPGLLPRALAGQLVGQGFIRRRGVVRWVAHQCLFWGVIGATLITFPLVFGWLAFRIEPGTVDTYQMFVFNVPTVTFDPTSFLGWSMFHALDYTAVLVIAGCAIFLWRRFRDRAVIAGQRLGYDMVPLLMLVVIAVTGLLLTASASLFEGAYYDFLVIIHMAAVVLSLVFIPFGKFFHVVQRPASVGIQMYAEVNGREGRRPCVRCGEPLASEAFVADLQATLTELGQDYRLDPAVHAAPHLTDLCPRCKRVARADGYFAVEGSSFAP